MTERIPVAGPWITEREASYAADAALHGWYRNATLWPTRFETAFAAHLGVRHAVSLPSCTAGLHLGLVALGIGPGDEVVVPDLTWIATVAPLSYVGATAVFADVDPHTWCITPESLAACITPRTRAVIPVDLYGGMPDLVGIRELAQRHGLVVIEDAAQAIGATLHGRPGGSFGDVATFSFHGSKTLATGEGGMLVTDRDDVHSRVLVLRDHGRVAHETRMFYNHELAFKYRMSSVTAAVGLAQLERVAELVGRKREIFGWYREALAGVPGIALNAEPPGVENAYWMTTVVWDEGYGIAKEAMIATFDTAGIDTRPIFYTLSSLPAFGDSEQAKAARQRNVVAASVSSRGVNLPSALTLRRDDVERVARVLRETLEAAR